MIFVADIQRCVAAHYGVPVETMTQSSQGPNGAGQWKFARPRQVAMYLATRLTEQTKSNIGRLFGGRDHTTVIHALRQIEARIAQDAEFAETLKTLRSELVSASFAQAA